MLPEPRLVSADSKNERTSWSPFTATMYWMIIVQKRRAESCPEFLMDPRQIHLGVGSSFHNLFRGVKNTSFVLEKHRTSLGFPRGVEDMSFLSRALTIRDSGHAAPLVPFICVVDLEVSYSFIAVIWWTSLVEFHERLLWYFTERGWLTFLRQWRRMRGTNAERNTCFYQCMYLGRLLPIIDWGSRQQLFWLLYKSSYLEHLNIAAPITGKTSKLRFSDPTTDDKDKAHEVCGN